MCSLILVQRILLVMTGHGLQAIGYASDFNQGFAQAYIEQCGSA